MSPVPEDHVAGAGRRPADSAGRPVYRRSIGVESVMADDDHLRVTGHLRDERPPMDGDGPERPMVVHDMSLSLTVRIADLVVVDVVADMSAFPHTECPLITSRFAHLIGVPVRRGFSRELNRRLGGVAGCSHLVEIARSIAPVVTQSMLSGRVPIRRDPAEPAEPSRLPVGSCHLWQPDGVAVRKLGAGWIPGTGPRPVPPLRVFTAGMRAGTTTGPPAADPVVKAAGPERPTP
jgi:hypothetical protein